MEPATQVAAGTAEITAAPPRWHAFGLDSATVKLVVAGAILPNLLMLATMLSIVDIGLPPRPLAIVLYGVIALCARRYAFPLLWIGFIEVFAFDVVWTIAFMFGFAPSELIAALDEAREINLLASPLYVALLLVTGLTVAACLWLLARRCELAQGNAYVLIGVVALLAGIDLLSDNATYYRFSSLFSPNRSVVSAMDRSGFGAVAGTAGRNAVVVVVESFGFFNDPRARELIAAPLMTSDITDRYAVTSGHADYFGTTTSGEMRELCHTRAPYREVAETSGDSCFPHQMQRRGYTTLAFHGFLRTMFGREGWYPKIGFDRAMFGEDIMMRTRRLCGGVVQGVCDADLAPIIAGEAAKVKGPRFIYWLTLNTHIPVHEGDALTDFGCDRDARLFGTRKVCMMSELWRDAFNVIAKLANDPAIGPADILIVGDHAPPLWSKRGRAQFMPGQVAWYRLTPR